MTVDAFRYCRAWLRTALHGLYSERKQAMTLRGRTQWADPSVIAILHGLDATSSVTNAAVPLQRGTTTVAGTYNVGDTTISGGTVNVDSTATTGTLTPDGPVPSGF